MRSNTPKEVLLIAELAEIMKVPKPEENDGPSLGAVQRERTHNLMSHGKKHWKDNVIVKLRSTMTHLCNWSVRALWLFGCFAASNEGHAAGGP